MKKKHAQQGSLTVEASLAIPLFLFFFMFVLSYVPVFAAQMMVQSCMAQAAQSMSVQSYGYKKLEDTAFLDSGSPLRNMISGLTDDTPSTTTSFVADSSAWYKTEEDTRAMARQMFVAYLGGGDEDRADAILQSLNVRDGLAGVDFTGSKVLNGDLFICVKYTVEMRFMRFFGLGDDGMVFEEQVCVRMWSEGDLGGVGGGGAYV